MSLDHFYRELDPTLPDLGWLRIMPRQPDAAAARAIGASTEVVALGALAGASRAFWATAGAVPMTAFAGAACVALGWHEAAAGVWIAGAVASMIVIEARRRARQWQALAEARIAELTGTTR